MTLRHIRIFLAVCNHDNNITRAAESLYMTQPAVSLAIHELENYYGVRLFERISRKLYITEAGKQMQEYASHLLSMFDDMERELRNWDSAGILRVGASITIGSQFMPEYVSRYQIVCPAVEVKVQVGPTGYLEKELLANQLDFALVEGYFESSRYHTRLCRREGFFGVCPPGHRLAGRKAALDELAGERLILREPGSGTRAILERGLSSVNRSIQDFSGIVTISDFAIIKSLVADGLGISFLYAPVVAEELAQGKLARFELAEVPMSGAFNLVCLKDNLFAANWVDWLV